MTAKELTDGGLVSTNKFWEVSIPVMVASIIVPIVFSGLLVRWSTQALRSGYKFWLQSGGSLGFCVLLALNVASAVRGGLPLFWTVWTVNILYVLGFQLAALLSRFNKIKEAREVWQSRSQEGTRMLATAVTATASRATGDAIEVDIVVPITDSGEVENTQMTAIAGPSQVSVQSSTSTSSTTFRKGLTMLKGRFYIQIIMLLIHLGIFALSSTFLVLDILYHPKTRPSLSFYHSFALWFSLPSHIKGFIIYVERERAMGLQSLWYQLATKFRRDKQDESDEPRNRDSSRAESDRASAV